MADYNINTLFEIAFGVTNIATYRPRSVGSPADGRKFLYKDVTVTDDDEEIGRMSYLGTPVVFPITFSGGKYQTYNNAGEITTEDFREFELPVATLVNFRRPKIIRKTKIPGSKGTVKELYGSDDWLIDIRGICLADPSHAWAKTAMQQHEALVNFDRIFDSINLSGVLFEKKSIHKLVIDDISFTQLPGKPKIMPFTIRASSDEPEELILL